MKTHLVVLLVTLLSPATTLRGQGEHSLPEQTQNATENPQKRKGAEAELTKILEDYFKVGQVSKRTADEITAAYNNEQTIQQKMSDIDWTGVDVGNVLRTMIEQKNAKGILITDTDLPQLYALGSDTYWVKYFEREIPKINADSSIHQTFSLESMLNRFTYNLANRKFPSTPQMRERLRSVLSNSYKNMEKNYKIRTQPIFNRFNFHLMQFAGSLGSESVMTHAKPIVDDFLNGKTKEITGYQMALFALDALAESKDTDWDSTSKNEARKIVARALADKKTPDSIRSKFRAQ